MVTRMIGLGIATALLAGCGDTGAPKQSSAASEQAILAKEEAWNAAYAKRDAEALAGFFADDAAMAAPGSQLVRGKDSVREANAAMAKDPNLKLSFRANRVQVAQSGDLAYSRGQYMLTMTNPQTKQPESSRGYYLTVWQKQADGDWKAVEDFITPGPALPVTERATMVQ